ncbi:MAG TPA: fumarylacetoacetate hydrolase family protein [Actinomycetes bacterium]|nr:fumarylacetoacetate hydrolase family protein [Actinomycetes bacterium]
MKLLTYRTGTGSRAALVLDGSTLPLREGVTVLDVVRAGLPVQPDRWVSDEPGLDPSSLVLDVPYRPPTVRDFVAFEEHVEGVRKAVDGVGGVVDQWYEYPTFYFTNPYALVATGDPVPVPQASARLDFELEVGIVIGRSGHDLAPARAHENVFGFTIFNDWSARDLQSREMKVNLGPAKGKDFATTIGPVIVTADELRDHLGSDGFLDLAMVVSVNGSEVGRDLLSNMGWPIGDLVAYASRDTWVHPGDLLGTGTCGNGGCLAELWGRSGSLVPPPLQPGDVVTMTVEGIGTITNEVVAGVATPAIPRARQRPRNRPDDARLARARAQ